MQLLDNLTTDWKKRAASAASPDMTTEEVEKAFFDQSLIAISNKCAPLMKAPYRVGFEIVHSNDARSRIIGIFIFRVGKELYYAPVFFINGSIKGTDLLYRKTTKTFVPLTPDWAEYLIGMNQPEEGHGSPIGDRQLTREQMNLRDVVNPPLNYKVAALQAWAEIKMRAPEKLAGGVLRQFILEDGRHDAVTKLANTASRNFPFAEALALSLTPEDYAPEIPFEKEASHFTEPLLTVHTAVLWNKQVKKATITDLRKGYLIEDFRKEAAETVYDVAPTQWESISSPGIYEALGEDGTTKNILVAYDRAFPLDKWDRAPASRSFTHRQDFIVADLDSGAARDFYDLTTRFGKLKSDDVSTAPGLVDKPTAGKFYRILNTAAKSLSGHFKVVSVAEDNSLTRVTVQDSCYTTPENHSVLFLNPDYEKLDPAERVLGKACKFLPVKIEEEDGRWKCDDTIPLGKEQAIYAAIFDQGYKKATCLSVGSSFVVVDDMTGQKGPFLCKTAAILDLMADRNLREAAAESVLAKTTAAGKFSFFYPGTVKLAMEKSGYNLRIDRFPEFRQTVDSDFGVTTEPHSQQILRADYEKPFLLQHRIGDRYSDGGGSNGDDAIDTASPMDLYQMSQERGNSALFEHGVVKELIDTYDSMAMIDKYMPKLEGALDCLGRILFLFYWKPEDFVSGYGSDDQSQLENKLISNFKSFGDLVLELLQKTRKSQHGNVSLT